MIGAKINSGILIWFQSRQTWNKIDNAKDGSKEVEKHKPEELLIKISKDN